LGFVLVSLALLILQILIHIFRHMYLGTEEQHTPVRVREMFELISGYGLGGSTVALFGRVGGGIFTKAADVGSDIAGKNVQGLPEDSPDNPGVIADNVGDNVGDIAGMGADLFGSLAESTCAALVVGATSYELIHTPEAIYFPLLITSAGIIASFITTFFATHFSKVSHDNVENVVKWQLIISTILMSLAVYPLTYVLPSEFTFDFGPQMAIVCTPLKAYICVMCGLWSGLMIGFITEIYTSNRYNPVQDLAEAC
jgi:Na+/H+-translocating membrane pyrophosphatase